jgi:hypothetical protein
VSVTWTGVAPRGSYPRYVLPPGDDFGFNLNNANARALLGLLGLEVTEELLGEADLPTVRRGILAARARFDRLAPAYARVEYVLRGARREDEDGVTGLEAPVRVYSPAFTAEDLRDRLERFAAYVEELAAAGATSVSWG